MMNTVVVLLRLTYSATSAPVCQAPLFSGPDAGSIGLWGRSAVVRQRGIVCQRDQGLSRGFPGKFETIFHIGECRGRFSSTHGATLNHPELFRVAS
jgi:hypothetical protein